MTSQLSCPTFCDSTSLMWTLPWNLPITGMIGLGDGPENVNCFLGKVTWYRQCGNFSFTWGNTPVLICIMRWWIEFTTWAIRAISSPLPQWLVQAQACDPLLSNERHTWDFQWNYWKRDTLSSGIGKQVSLELVMAIFDIAWRECAGKWGLQKYVHTHTHTGEREWWWGGENSAGMMSPLILPFPLAFTVITKYLFA